MWQQKTNKLTPRANIMYEASRMILPEHRQALVHHHRSQRNRKKRPTLDDQRMQDISYAVGSSMSEGEPITFILLGQFEDREVTGMELYTVLIIDLECPRFRKM